MRRTFCDRCNYEIRENEYSPTIIRYESKDIESRNTLSFSKDLCKICTSFILEEMGVR